MALERGASEWFPAKTLCYIELMLKHLMVFLFLGANASALPPIPVGQLKWNMTSSEVRQNLEKNGVRFFNAYLASSKDVKDEGYFGTFQGSEAKIFAYYNLEKKLQMVAVLQDQANGCERLAKLYPQLVKTYGEPKDIVKNLPTGYENLTCQERYRKYIQDLPDTRLFTTYTWYDPADPTQPVLDLKLDEYQHIRLRFFGPAWLQEMKRRNAATP